MSKIDIQQPLDYQKVFIIAYQIYNWWYYMDNQYLFMIMGLISLGLIVLFSIGLYVWYFKLGGKKLVETS